MIRKLVVLIALAVGLFNIVFGFWALFAPRSFFDAVATFEPYNHHFLHDVGAFQAGLGVVLFVALLRVDGLTVAFAGNAVAGILHFGSHLVDRDLGGRAIDPLAVGALAVAVVLGLILVMRPAATTLPKRSV